MTKIVVRFSLTSTTQSILTTLWKNLVYLSAISNHAYTKRQHQNNMFLTRPRNKCKEFLLLTVKYAQRPVRIIPYDSNNVNLGLKFCSLFLGAISALGTKRTAFKAFSFQ